MEEEWKEIAGWPEYLISSYGRVFSVRNDKIMNPGLDTYGYPQVKLSVKMTKKRCLSII